MHDSLRPTYFRPMLAVAAIAALLLMFAALVQPVSADPPGGNGTVKVDGVPFDQGPGDNGPGDPDNEPHINACFAIDWYNFDMGEFYGTVTFQIWPPVGPKDVIDGVATQVLHTPSDGHDAFGGHDQIVYIGEDTADGANTAGRDASIVYDLSAALANYEPHEAQGWHVKISIDNEGTGANNTKKSKVVWVNGPCASVETEPPGGSTSTPTTSPSGTGGELGGTSSPRGGRIPDTSFGLETGQLVMILAGLLLAGSVATLGFDAVRRGRTTR